MEIDIACLARLSEADCKYESVFLNTEIVSLILYIASDKSLPASNICLVIGISQSRNRTTEVDFLLGTVPIEMHSYS